MGLIVANAAIADDSTEKPKDKAAGTNIPNGRQVGDTLEWNGRAWTPVAKPVTGFVLLDANGEVIGSYDRRNHTVLLDINNTYYELPVTSKGFPDMEKQFPWLLSPSDYPDGRIDQQYFTSFDCTGTAHIPIGRAISQLQSDFPLIAPVTYATIDNKLMGLGNTETIVANSYQYWVNGDATCYSFTFEDEVHTDPNNRSIIIEDLSRYTVPFSIKAN